MLEYVIYILVVLVLAGFILWAIGRAPFIDAEIKGYIHWVVIVLAGLFLLYFLYCIIMLMAGMAPGHMPMRR